MHALSGSTLIRLIIAMVIVLPAIVTVLVVVMSGLFVCRNCLKHLRFH